MQPAHLDHVALLVPSIDRPVEALAGLGVTAGEIESWPAEGTREVYMGPSPAPARLLLQEAIGPGPYAEALRKRGPGVHHVALVVPDLEGWIGALAGSGWYLHPRSLATIRDGRTAWLARPGVGALIEVQERAEPMAGAKPVVTRIEVPARGAPPGLWSGLGVPSLGPSPDAGAWLEIAGRRFAASALSLGDLA